MTIGDRIKQKRIEMDISQTDLADKINVSKQTLYKYENNIVTNIPSDKIEALAKAFNCSESYLMGWTDIVLEVETYNEEQIKKHYGDQFHRLYAYYSKLNDVQKEQLMSYANFLTTNKD